MPPSLNVAPTHIASPTPPSDAVGALRALRVDVHSSQLEFVDAAKVTEADRAGIAGTGYHTMTMGPGIALLVDDHARGASEPLNLWATVLTHTFGSNTVVF